MRIFKKGDIVNYPYGCGGRVEITWVGKPMGGDINISVKRPGIVHKNEKIMFMSELESCNKNQEF